MKKHFVRTFSTAVLIAGSLVVVAAQPASAFRYFVHGNVHCTINSGHVDFAPTLRETISQQTRMRIKGTFTCDVGETGVDGTVVTGGKFKMISNPYGGNCTSGHTDEVEMVLQWTWNPGGVKVRNTEVSWVWDDANDNWSPDPYQYHFVGGTTNVFGLSGSYTGATAAANFVGLSGSAACHQLDGNGRLRGGFALDTSGLSDFTFQSPPFINQSTGVNPNSAPLGTQNLNVDITGQDFTPGDSVSFSGTGITVNSTTVNSATDMTANISIDSNALAGTRDVTVTDATLGSNTCAACFMVSPIVNGATPATAGQGATNRNITITGEGFANGAIVQFGPSSGITTNYTQFIDGNTLNANISVAPAAPLTTYDITVTDPGNGVGTCSACFSVNSGPTVTDTNPSSRGVGATNQTVAIDGTGFDPGSTVTFGGSGISVSNISYVSSSQLMATISIAPGSANGNRSVTVLNSDGGQGGCAACFTVNKAPTVTLWQVSGNGRHSINPNPDPQGRRDRDVYTVQVTITGTNFQAGTVVTYPAAAVTTLIVNSQTVMSSSRIIQNITIDYGDFSQLQANPPDRTIIVTNPDGGTSSLPGAVILVG
jgi:hypothetical protein